MVAQRTSPKRRMPHEGGVRNPSGLHTALLANVEQPHAKKLWFVSSQRWLSRPLRYRDSRLNNGEGQTSQDSSFLSSRTHLSVSFATGNNRCQRQGQRLVSPNQDLLQCDGKSKPMRGGDVALASPFRLGRDGGAAIFPGGSQPERP